MSEVMKRFGEKLYILRKRDGLSQKQMSEILDVSESYVWKMEHSQKTPNAAMLIKIAQLFNVSFDQLMNDELEVD